MVNYYQKIKTERLTLSLGSHTIKRAFMRIFNNRQNNVADVGNLIWPFTLERAINYHKGEP